MFRVSILSRYKSGRVRARNSVDSRIRPPKIEVAPGVFVPLVPNRPLQFPPEMLETNKKLLAGYEDVVVLEKIHVPIAMLENSSEPEIAPEEVVGSVVMEEPLKNSEEDSEDSVEESDDSEPETSNPLPDSSDKPARVPAKRGRGRSGRKMIIED